MSQRRMLQTFEQYQRARVQFVQTIADLSSQKHHIDGLQSCGVMSLLRPLLIDTVPTIQQTAAIALGRLANQKEELAEAIVKEDILPQLVYSLAEQNRFYKKAAAFVMKAVAKHSPELAQKVVDSGALDALVIGLEEFDPGVKEESACALSYIARHSAELAQSVVDAGAVPLLVLCIQEPELSLKRVGAAALSDIAKHSSELAQMVVDAGAIAHLAQYIINSDLSVKRHVLAALSTIAKHSVDHAELVVEGEIFPAVLVCLKEPDECVQKNCAILIRDVVKHTPELSQLVVNSGGIAALVEYIGCSKGYNRLPAIMAIGYIAAHSETLAMAVIVSKGVLQLKCTLMEETKPDIQAVSVWALGQIGRYTPEHAKAVAEADVISQILNCYLKPDASEDLKAKAKVSLKNIIEKCVKLEHLELLLYRAPSNIIKYAVAQFSKILPHDCESRRLFVATGALKRIQELKGESKGELAEYIAAINSCFPEEVVRYYSPGFVDTLMDRVSTYEVPV